MLTQSQALAFSLMSGVSSCFIFLIDYLMPALKAALPAFQINILYSCCVQGLLCFADYIASTLCLYREKNLRRGVFFFPSYCFCILYLYCFLFLLKICHPVQ